MATNSMLAGSGVGVIIAPKSKRAMRAYLHHLRSRIWLIRPMRVRMIARIGSSKDKPNEIKKVVIVPI